MEKKIQPQLRFSEFKDSWKNIELEKLIEISKVKYNPLKSQENYRCIELESLSQETGKLLGFFNSLEQQSMKNKFQKNQVLYGKLRPYLKKYYKPDFEGVCSSEIWVLNGKKVSNNFLYELIKTNKFNLIANVSSGSKMPRADWSYMKEIPFGYPSLTEQDKIADFLSSIGENIESLEDKLELMEKYREGIMQKIFSQKIRFKDAEGREYPEWKEVKLGDIISLNLREVAKPQVAYGALGVRSHAKGTFHKEVEDPTTVAMDKLYQVKKDDFIVSITFAWEHAVAVCTAEDEDRLVSHRFPTYRAKENLDINFFRYVIVQKRFKYLLDLISPGGAGRNRVLSKPSLLKLKITIPCLEEQRKIADFLSSIDKEIKVLEEEIKGNKEFKKGLLQQMFV